MLAYRFEDLKQYATAENVARDFANARIGSDHRCAAVWRGGDGNNVEFYTNGTFYDFKTKEGGDGVDLLCMIRNITRDEAVEVLGDYYCPSMRVEKREKPQRKPRAKKAQTAPSEEPAPAYGTVLTPASQTVPSPPPSPTVTASPMAAGVARTVQSFNVIDEGAKNRYETLLHEGYTDTPYYYCDIDGNVVRTVHRMDKPGFPKEFLQSSEKYGWTTKALPSMLYHLDRMPKARRVLVAEGEKCADAIISILPNESYTATTNIGGAGRWRTEFADYFAGKEVVVFSDNDEVGREHAQTIAESLVYVAKWVKLIVPGASEKEDIADRIYGELLDFVELEKMVEAAPIVLPKFAFSVTDGMIQDAKEANATPFCNYRKVEDTQKLREMSDMLEEIKRRFLGFPCCLGGNVLFDRDRKTGRIRYIHDTAQFIAWMNTCSGLNVNWNKSMDKKEFLAFMILNTRRYDTISGTPHYPPKPNVFYNCPAIRKQSPGCIVFEKLLDFFSPANSESRTFLKALFMAPVWGRRRIARPVWVIDSVNGAGVGKTTLVSMLGLLYGEKVMDFRQADMSERLMTETKKRLVSNEGRNNHILLIDNVEGVFDSDMFSAMVTSDTISARPAYGVEEVWRENDFTSIITMNNAKLSDDMVRRSFFIDLKKPSRNYSLWRETVIDFIERNRDQITSDIFNILATPPKEVWPTTSRFPEFSRDILQHACQDRAEFDAAMEFLARKQRETNVNMAYLPNIQTEVRGRLYDLKIQADSEYVFLQSRVVSDWLKMEGRKFTVSNLIDFVRNGQTANFTEDMLQLKTYNGTPCMNGILWIGDNARGRQSVKIVQMSGNVIEVKDCIQNGETIYYERRADQ